MRLLCAYSNDVAKQLATVREMREGKRGTSVN